MKSELTKHVIRRFKSLNDSAKSTSLSVSYLDYPKRVTECLKTVFQAIQRNSVFSERRTEKRSTRTFIASMSYPLYTAECD